MTAVDLSSFAGLTAMVLLSLNVLLGLLVTTNYSPLKQWPRRKVPVFKIHNWTGYAAMCVVLLHPTLLLFSSTASFKALDILWPVHSPGQRLYNLLGATAFYTITLVVVTSYFRPRLGSRTWKKLHWTAYFAAAVLLTHGLLIDPDLKNGLPICWMAKRCWWKAVCWPSRQDRCGACGTRRAKCGHRSTAPGKPTRSGRGRVEPVGGQWCPIRIRAPPAAGPPLRSGAARPGRRAASQWQRPSPRRCAPGGNRRPAKGLAR